MYIQDLDTFFRKKNSISTYIRSFLQITTRTDDTLRDTDR